MHFKTTRVLLFMLAWAAWLAGCADVPSTGPKPPELIAEFRFVHAAGDLGNIGVSVDGATLGNVAFKGNIPHAQFPAGSRLTVLSSGDSLLVAMESYKRGTVVILPKTGPTREFIKLSERRVFDPINTEKALLQIVHAAQAPEVDVKIVDGNNQTVTTFHAAYRGISGYLQIPTGNYQLVVTAAGGTQPLLTSALAAANKRQTVVILGSAAAQNLALVNLADD